MSQEVFEAIRAGDAKRLAQQIAQDPSLALARDESGLSAVMRARYRWRSDLVEILLEAASELDVFEASALCRISRLEALLDADPDLVRSWSPDGFTPLHLASFFGLRAAAALLLARGAYVSAVSRNPMKVMPLHSAAAGPGDRRPVAEALMDAGAEVDARTHGGLTPLQAAAESGDEELVELLLARGADPTLANEEGKTAIDLAVEAGHEELAEELREEAS
jgi:ankyrin repeat protein